MPEQRSLHRKLAQVLYEAERIPKRGKAPAAMGGYPFVQVGDAADYIRKALAEKVLTMMPTAVHVVGQQDRETKNGGNMTTVDLVVDWTISDGESGETIVIQSFGAGADGGDKYSGKAMTSAMKYAMLSGFLLSTGDDTEASDTGVQRPAGAPAAATPPPPPAAPRDGSLIGIAEVAKAPHDFELRHTPTGPVIGFGLKEGRTIVRVLAHGDLAETIAASLTPGTRVTVFGTMTDETWTLKQGTAQERTVPYIALTASRIEGLTTEAETPQAGEGPTSEPEPQTPSGSQLCGEKGPPSIPGGASCTLAKGHAGKHRELATDGHALASWAEAA